MTARVVTGLDEVEHGQPGVGPGPPHEARARQAAPDGHVERVDDVGRAQVPGNWPTDDAATEHVEHDREVEEALPGRQGG